MLFRLHGKHINTTCLDTGEFGADRKFSDRVISEFIKNIVQSSAVILESSVPSFLVSYASAMSMTHNKPVLIISNDPRYHFSFESSRIFVRHYKNIHEIESLVTGFLKIVESMQATKFNFILPPELDSYLEWTSRQRKKPKSEIAREALQRVMENDTEYNAAE
jgi:hypothetical protein